MSITNIYIGQLNLVNYDKNLWERQRCNRLRITLYLVSAHMNIHVDYQYSENIE